MSLTTSSRRAAATASGTAAVDLRAVTKTFGDVRAVDGIDLRVEPGEIVAFLGPNGAGKSSTIDMMLGLSRPTSGSVSIYGTTPADAIAHGRIAAVLQSGGLLKDLTVGETVRLTASLYHEHQPVDEVLQRAGITGIADRRVVKCSGGEQQRLRFAMALLPDPDLLVLDEPTTGMDVEGRRAFWGAIRDDAAQGRTVLFATHYLDEADAYADRIVLVRHGQIVADGSASEIKAMASGRSVRATLPGADVASLRALPGVTDVSVRGNSVTIAAADTDTVARHLLNATPARDLEITTHNLEDAFVALTSDEPSNGRPTSSQAPTAPETSPR